MDMHNLTHLEGDAMEQGTRWADPPCHAASQQGRGCAEGCASAGKRTCGSVSAGGSRPNPFGLNLNMAHALG